MDPWRYLRYNIYIFPKFEDDYYNFRLPIFSTDHLFLLNLNKQISISLKDHFSPVVNEIEKVHPPQFSIFAERLYRTKFQLASKNRDEILKCSIKIPPWNRDCPSFLRLSRLYRIRRYWNKWKGGRNKLKLPENSSLNDLLRNFHRFSTVLLPLRALLRIDKRSSSPCEWKHWLWLRSNGG